MVTYTPQLIYKDDFANLFQITIETDFNISTNANVEKIQQELLAYTLHRYCDIHYDHKSNRLIIRITENSYFKGIRIADYQYYDYEKGFDTVQLDGAQVTVQNPKHFINTNAEGFGKAILNLSRADLKSKETLRTQALQHKINKNSVSIPKVPNKKRAHNKISEFTTFHFERYHAECKKEKDIHIKKFPKQPNIKYEIVATTKEAQPRVVGIKQKTFKNKIFNIALYTVIIVVVISAFIAGMEYMQV